MTNAIYIFKMFIFSHTPTKQTIFIIKEDGKVSTAELAATSVSKKKKNK